MTRLDPDDLLAAWQVLWGQLDSGWQKLFLLDPLVNEIIAYDSETIYKSLKKFRKLSEVLIDIQNRELNKERAEQLEKKINEESLARQDERERQMELRKIKEAPKRSKPNPKDIPPLTADEIEVRRESLWYQNSERGWW